ncbi:uncharacterized protein PV06_08313 [Exophiala oligosperma]|uniref:Uncharacterized protein n=1 Tax=Exophiala oligosperma TaxID=215243 RepID=A0A0D2DW26_9EURO|nr:uncharacterized protein PV06_08313 [Exophiala oligosperma]KIW39724.1 hypothetical protein PV06_08313 [Exophiala oligosperma]
MAGPRVTGALGGGTTVSGSRLSSPVMILASTWTRRRTTSINPVEMSDETLIDLSDEQNMKSIYFNTLSYFSSRMSTGAAIEM